MTEPTVVLLDIEGTTTPIRFVTDVLFPYARAHMRSFLLTRVRDADFVPTLSALVHNSHQEQQLDPSAPDVVTHISAENTAETATAFALWLMDRDRKSTPLKQIQGEIWRTGYEQGALQGVVYPDAVAAIQRWKAQGKRVAIYSSGSIEAQKLIFGYSDHGDLRPWLDAYFDTTSGPKKASDSYLNIAQQMNVKPQEITFLSDNMEELLAARDAGVHGVLAVRPGNAPTQDTSFPRVTNFDALYPQH